MSTAHAELTELENQLMSLRERISKLRDERADPIPGFGLQTLQGQVTLTQLFGAKDELLVIHNMGIGCSYCTLWADGLNGFVPHLESRASVVLVSPDAPEVQRAFARDRGWNYLLASDDTRQFSKAMGFYTEEGAQPGISAFHKDINGRITRTGSANFGEYDDFCPIWHILGLLKGGVGEWAPKYRYLDV